MIYLPILVVAYTCGILVAAIAKKKYQRAILWTGVLIPFFSILLLIGLETDKEEAAGTVLNVSLPFLKSDECERVKGQLSYIAHDMKGERQQSRSRGFHM